VDVLACKIRATSDIKGFLLPGAGSLQFKVCPSGDDTTAFVKDERSLFALFQTISQFERDSGAKLNNWRGWRPCGGVPGKTGPASRSASRG